VSTQQPPEPDTAPGSPPPEPEDAPTTRPTGDPLRGSRTSGTWVAVLVLAVVLLLLAVFILQNTQRVEVSFFGWTGQAPLAATLLIAAAGGALVVAGVGILRILQLRRRVKRQRKS
jgi:uncharacterized integral membrane protein